MRQENIIIQNLKCGGCASTITRKLNEVDGIMELDVNIDDSSVSITAENDKVIDVVKDKLKSLGYPIVDEDNSILSKAKSFVSCAKGRIK